MMVSRRLTHRPSSTCPRSCRRSWSQNPSSSPANVTHISNSQREDEDVRKHTGDQGKIWMRSTLLMLRMSFRTENKYDGALLMLKCWREVSPLTSSKL